MQAAEIDVRIDQLRKQANELASEFKNYFEQAHSLTPSLKAIEAEGDKEATEMRRCFVASQQAYNDDDKASAKELSVEGNEHKRNCESLNQRAQDIRNRTRYLSNLGKQKQAECQAINKEIARLIEAKREIAQQAWRLTVSRGGISIGEKLIYKAGLDQRRVSLIYSRFSSLTHQQEMAFKVILADTRTDHTELLRGLANPKLNEDIVSAIPQALAEVLHTHPEVAGLFSGISTRDGARSWVGNLKNDGTTNSANGTAYELLATRRLMNQAAGNLQIYSTDKITFGPKLQARYEPSSLKVRELLAALTEISYDSYKRWNKLRAKPEAIGRKTVESDVAIGRPSSGNPWKYDEIFVDYKYSQGVSRNLEPPILLGVAVALLTGEITEAHFVCNAALSSMSYERIDDINEVLISHGCGLIYGHQNFSW